MRPNTLAAAVLERDGFQHWLPMLQLTGHAVELSLKACLASAGVEPPRDHDLIDLYRQAKEAGFSIGAPDFAALVHLRHFYFQDLGTKTKYKTRYPTSTNEYVGGAVPSNAVFATIVTSLLEQAKERAKV